MTNEFVVTTEMYEEAFQVLLEKHDRCPAGLSPMNVYIDQNTSETSAWCPNCGQGFILVYDSKEPKWVFEKDILDVAS